MTLFVYLPPGCSVNGRASPKSASFKIPLLLINKFDPKIKFNTNLKRSEFTFDISMQYIVAVTIMKSFQQLFHVALGLRQRGSKHVSIV